MKRNEFEGLYVDDETYEDYINRKLSESVQYKPKEEYNDKIKYATVEELTMSKYYDYEVEDEEDEKPKEKADWSEVVLAIVYWGGIIGLLIYVIYAIIRVVNGG